MFITVTLNFIFYIQILKMALHVIESNFDFKFSLVVGSDIKLMDYAN